LEKRKKNQLMKQSITERYFESGKIRFYCKNRLQTIFSIL